MVIELPKICQMIKTIIQCCPLDFNGMGGKPICIEFTCT